MSKKYMLFPGCLIQVRFPQLEYVARKILPAAGIELESDGGDFMCCPDPIQVGGAHRLFWLTIGARNLCVAEARNCNIVCLCNGCVNTLTRIQHQLNRNKEVRGKVNGILKDIEKEYKGVVEARHFMQVFKEDIAVEGVEKLVKKPLTGLRVATHPGCHLLRPEHIIRFDNPRDPLVFDTLVEALGATAVDYDSKADCCGVSLSLTGDIDGSIHCLGAKMKEITSLGAQALVTGCPFCYQQFVLMQKKVAKQFSFREIPVYYYTQLLGIAMGYTLEDMQLKNDRTLERLLLEKR